MHSMHLMYIPLRVESCFSILESTIELPALAAAAREGGIPAIGLADKGNLFAAMAFSNAMMKVGVQPVIGTMLPIRRDDGARGRNFAQPAIDHLVLFAQNEAGWGNLLALSSESHLHGVFPLEALAGRSADLLCLTGGADGALARLYAEEQQETADAMAEELLRLFGDRLYVELSRTDEPVEAASEEALLDFAYRRGVPIVATNKACFLKPEGHAAHDAMLCIADGSYLQSGERRRSNPRHYLLAAAEMAERFADLPEALANSELVAKRTALALRKRDPVLPKLVPDPEEERRTLRRLAEEGLAHRLAAKNIADAAPYRERLAYELGIIETMDFPGYFLIVADFVHWAKEQGIPVGPGRGSGAGSVVAWALTITELDPLALGLIFERFLNPERKSMPDFDIDFCETRREEVIRYVQRKYGEGQVAQIITFGTLKARAVVKDVGRVMQLPYGQVNRLSNLIPANPTDPWNLDRTIANIPEFRAEIDADPKLGQLIRIARQIEGRPRHSSTHAAGVVIGDRQLSELVPLYRDPRSDFPVTQFDLKWAEAAGLVKFDFLGLKTLSVLERARQLLAAHGIAIDLHQLPLDDPEVYALMTRGDTVGVFQFESEGMRRALALVKPTLFEDIIALGALYRPGPMDNIPSFAARKWGREEPDYLHPMLEPILRPTYGVIIYQEQVMQIAQVLAGYSLGEADLLRRAMGKKIKAEMDAQRSRFLSGAEKNGVSRRQAETIFDLVDKFAGYGFNKSHAAAYALVAWQTAWLKRHHPAAFYAGSMSYDLHLTDKLAVFAEDMRRLGVPLLPPAVNASGANFTLEKHGDGFAVRYALGALKGVGEGAMAAIVAERERGGPFRDLDDFITRVDPHGLNRRQIEVLAAAGAFDDLGVDRARLYAGAEHALQAAQSAASERESGQHGLFEHAPDMQALALPAAPAWSFAERLAKEYEAFGFWFGGHPLDLYRAILEGLGVKSADEAAALPDPGSGARRVVKMAGLVEDLRWRTPKGAGADRRYLVADLSDSSGKWGASCFDQEVGKRLEGALSAQETLLFDVELQWRDEGEAPRMAIRGAEALAAVAGAVRLKLRIVLAEDGGGAGAAGAAGAIAELAALLPRGGRSIVDVALSCPGKDPPPDQPSDPPSDPQSGPVVVRLGADFAVDSETRRRIAMIPGVAETALEPLSPYLKPVA